MIKLDVVGGCASGFKSYRLADDKGDGLGLRLLHNLGGRRPAFCFVQHLVGEFVNQGAELLSLGLSGENGNPSAVADAKRRSDLLGKDKLDALSFNEGNKTVAVLAYRSGHLPQRGKFRPFGLAHVKHIGVAEANQHAGVLLGDVLFGVLVLFALDADDGGKNADALLALLHFGVQAGSTHTALQRG